MGKEFPKKRVTYHEWPKDENIKKWKTEIQKTKSVANGLLAYSEIKVKDYKVAYYQVSELGVQPKIDVLPHLHSTEYATANATSSNHLEPSMSTVDQFMSLQNINESVTQHNERSCENNRISKSARNFSKTKRHVTSVEEKLRRYRCVLIGDDVIELCEEEPRMVKCLKSLKAMFEEEGKKNSELNAKSSFVLNFPKRNN
ncbi:hypothetical protein OUZ56_029528 [Daphnia magna]|uniref:Uncharacterized protein n=1 Tax=Daphnia magna TaxID=35525 RepID=A0ABR0B724_9CRUS|nr:hypothetical protein OUZ56_029528 [Daphnia magna]